MNKITTILFDVDGTLLDTSELILRAFEESFAKNGTQIPLRNEFISVVGKPLTLCYQILTGKTDVESYTKTHHNFQLQNLNLSRPFENSLKTLQELKAKSYKIAAVTSRKRASTEQTLKNAGLAGFIDFAVYADEVKNHKPDPEPLEKALHALGSLPNEAIMVGDSDADILGGKNTGTKTAAALYGFHGQRLKSLNPDYLLDDISEIIGVLQSS